jgi:hypothetical protein
MPTKFELLLAVAVAATSVTIQLARFAFYFRLRPGIWRSPVGLRVVDRFMGSIAWRTVLVSAVFVVLQLKDSLDPYVNEVGPRKWILCVFLLLYFLLEPSLHRWIRGWATDPDETFRSTLRDYLSIPFRADLQAWSKFEGELRKLVGDQTRIARREAVGFVDGLFDQQAAIIDRHVKRSRRRPFQFFKYPPYKDGQWYKELPSGHPQRIELLINALGFTRFRQLASKYPPRTTDLRGRERLLVGGSPWPATLRVNGAQVQAEFVDFSAAGACLRLPKGLECAALGIEPTREVQVAAWGTTHKLRVVWKRRQSFGGCFQALA